MHRQRFLLRIFAAIAFALAFAASAAAQQYQIVNAGYGYGSWRVDVTQRLREVARANNILRMGNSTFGIDPAPGYKKTLRIHARAPNGQNRMFEYIERPQSGCCGTFAIDDTKRAPDDGQRLDHGHRSGSRSEEDSVGHLQRRGQIRKPAENRTGRWPAEHTIGEPINS